MSALIVECPTIPGAIVYDHPIIGQVYMLVYHQVVHFSRLQSLNVSDAYSDGSIKYK